MLLSSSSSSPSPTPSSLCPGAEGNILVLKIIAASRLANGAVCNWKKSRLTYKNVVSNARFFPLLSHSLSRRLSSFSLSNFRLPRIRIFLLAQKRRSFTRLSWCMGGGARGNLDLLGLLFPRVIPFELKITKIAIITIFLEKVRSNAICVCRKCAT